MLMMIIVVPSMYVPWVDRHGRFCFWGWKWGKKVERVYMYLSFSKPPFLRENERQVTWRRRACYLFSTPPLRLVLTQLPGEWVRAAIEGAGFLRVCETLGSSHAVLGQESSSWKFASPLKCGTWPPLTPGKLTATLEIGRWHSKRPWAFSRGPSRANGRTVGWQYSRGRGGSMANTEGWTQLTCSSQDMGDSL